MKAKFLLLTFLILATVSAMAQQTRYVREVARGTGDGSSWANASSDLQGMINASSPTHLVYVAEGTYYPTTNPANRSASFTMKAGVSIYGGFPDFALPNLSQRNPDLYPTILSGDIDRNDGPNFTNNAGNSYHVLSNNGNGLTSSAVLDGFVITAGNANDPLASNNFGGGMYNVSSSPTLRYITFRANNATSGGGLYIQQSAISLSNVEFSGNNATNGGGLCVISATPTLNSVVFTGNTGNSGGGMYNDQSASSISNSIFSGNNATLGGGMYNIGSPYPSIFNSTFWDNNAGNQGGGMYNNAFNSSIPTVKNCIFWGNTTGGTTINSIGGNTAFATYSDIQGGYAGTGNINQDPSFIDIVTPAGADGKLGTADDGLKLRHCSPLINIGNNTGVPGTDILGNARIVNTTVDMGAFEYQGPGNRLYVKASAAANGDGSSWELAYQDLQSALSAANACSNINEIWVAEGIYYPTATNNRTISFVLKNGMTIYGGFPNSGNPGLANRNPAANETILSGDIDKNDGPNFTNNSGNSFHVVSNNNNGVNNTAVLDGFTISRGNANAGTSPNNAGGGMLNISATPKLVNIIFSGNNANQGGGISNTGASLSLNNVIFTGNNAVTNGGGMFNLSCAPVLSNVIFLGNTANQGGGIANSNASPNIINATFYGNNAVTNGGGIFGFSLSSPTIKNSIFWGNTVAGTTVSSIGGDNPLVTYSDIEGGYAGTGNINQDPLFRNTASPAGADNQFATADDGLSLKPCSPVLNIGNNTGVTSTDLIGNPRIYNVTADMGAYEYQNYTVSGTGTRVYVDASAAPNGDGSSWATAYTDLQVALASARLCTNINEIWVAKGTYKPTSGTDRTIAFELVPNVSIYGSFAGNETDTSQRTAAVMAANPTILSGDIDGVPDVVTGSGSTLVISGNAGNSLHVIYNNGNGVSTGNSRLDGFTITGGNANQGGISGSGAGICFNGTGTRMRNLIFTGNNATQGGGIYGDGHNLDIANASFINNYAGGGAGIDFRNAGITLNTVSFTGGRGGFGSGMNCQDVSGASLSNVTFTNNNGGEGGGLRSLSSGITLNNVTFSGNSASLNGGGMYSYGCGLIFNQTYFTNNTATFDGGGIYILGGPTKINRSFFLNNTARNGGGLYMTSGLFDNRNNVIAGNHATQKGGGFYFEDTGFSSGTFMYFATIAGNTAVQDGAGIFGAGSGGAEYYYCIVWGNKKGTLENNVGGYANLYFSNIGSYIPPFLSQHDIDQNPLFVDAANPAGADAILGTADDGLALLPCSPSINYIPYPYVDSLSGYVNTFPSSTSQDILFNPRRINFFAEMGAYESTSTGLSLPAVYSAKTQDIADTVFMETGCQIMAKIVPDPTATGVNLLAGDVEVKEWVETAPFSMVRRHYQVTPANNASTAKARVTLYFTQEDFDAYNATGNPVQLPTTPYILDPKVVNIEVVKYSGSSPDGMPGGYPAQTPVIIPNSALTIRWIGKVWAISFDVTGFSGFFIKSTGVTLPVKLLSFTGKSTTSGNLLNWKTANEINFSHFEIERSTDGRQFAKIGTMSSNTSGNYEFTDAALIASQYYYRLKMVDQDGKFTYSNIIRLVSFNPAKTFVGEAYPNPTAGTATIEINAVENESWTFSVVDVMGRVLHSFTRRLDKGNHIIQLSNLRQGLNYIKIESGSVHEIRKVVKH